MTKRFVINTLVYKSFWSTEFQNILGEMHLPNNVASYLNQCNSARVDDHRLYKCLSALNVTHFAPVFSRKLSSASYVGI